MKPYTTGKRSDRTKTYRAMKKAARQQSKKEIVEAAYSRFTDEELIEEHYIRCIIKSNPNVLLRLAEELKKRSLTPRPALIPEDMYKDLYDEIL